MLKNPGLHAGGFASLMLALCLVSLSGCAWLDTKQRQLIYRPTPGVPAHFTGLRNGDEQFFLEVPAAGTGAAHGGGPQALPVHDAAWQAALGWEKLVNRQGTSWRKLDAATQAGVHDAASASTVLQAQPSTIKRPVVEWADGRISCGFDAQRWSELLPPR